MNYYYCHYYSKCTSERYNEGVFFICTIFSIFYLIVDLMYIKGSVWDKTVSVQVPCTKKRHECKSFIIRQC